MKRQIEIPVHDNEFTTKRSLDANHSDNVNVLNYTEEKTYKDLLDEVKIRFDTNPKFYQREDYQKLIELFKYQGGITEDDLKTINGESIVGEGNIEILLQLKTINGESLYGEGDIEISSPEYSEGNAISLDHDVISVTSHIYDSENSNSDFGINNSVIAKNSVVFGENNSTELTSYEFIGYLRHSDDLGKIMLIPEQKEVHNISEEIEVNNLENSKLYLDDAGTEFVGTVSSWAYCGLDKHEIILDIEDLLEGVLDNIPNNGSLARSVWCKITTTQPDGFKNLALFGKNNKVVGKRNIDFVGYLNCVSDDTIIDGVEYTYKLAAEAATESHIPVSITDLLGVTLYKNGSCTELVGTIKDVYEFKEYGEDDSVTKIYINFEEDPEISEWISVWKNEETLIQSSLIQGSNNIISASNAHAEGSNTTAGASNAHSEGNTTIASGKQSHSEGLNTTASGDNSHSEGNGTSASGEASNAAGYETDAKGDYSHSEGYFTSAEGQSSHAEGNNTTALGQSAHSEGTGGNVTLLRVISPLSLEPSANNRLYYSNSVQDDSASDSSLNFLAGSDFMSDSDLSFLPNTSDVAVGAKYFVEKGNKLDGWIGRTLYYADGSVIGVITRFPDRAQNESGSWFEIDREVYIQDETSAYIKTGASGESSHSEGYLSDVSGKYGHAEGERTQSTGTAAHSEGIKTKAFGAYSHAEGQQTQALAFGTHTEGLYTHAEGEYSHAEGYDTKASGTYSHGEGFHSAADADYSHAEGHDSKASGIGAHSEGYASQAEGDYSHAEGYDTTAEDRNSHAEGQHSISHGESSHAEGYNTHTEAKYSHSEGKDTYALGEGSHVEGEDTITNGKFAHAEGYESQAHADYTHTEGWKTITEVRDDWVKIGTVTVKSVVNNYAQELPSFNFDVVSSNQNTIESAFDEERPTRIKFKNKELYESFLLKNYIVDYNAIVDGDFAVSPFGSEEYKADASNWDSDYIGHTFDVYRKYISGIAAHAEGFETLTEGSYSHAEGEKTQTKNRAEHAQGFRNKSHQNSFTLGDPGNTIFSVGIGNNHNIKPIILPENLGNCYSEGSGSYDLSSENIHYLQYSDDSISSFSYYIITDTLEDLEIFVGSKIFYKDFSDPINYPNGENVTLGIVTSAARIDVASEQDPTDDNYKIYFELDEYTSLPESPTIVYRTHKKPPIRESQEDKRNALEIMQNGDVYVKGVGSYNGDGIDEAFTLQQVLKKLLNDCIDPSKLDNTFEVIAAALNDLNNRLNDVDTVTSAILVNHEDRILDVEQNNNVPL